MIYEVSITSVLVSSLAYAIDRAWGACLSQHALACRSPRINMPPAAGRRRRPTFYSTFDWLDYGT
jgi:hypothetical protein